VNRRQGAGGDVQAGNPERELEHVVARHAGADQQARQHEDIAAEPDQLHQDVLARHQEQDERPADQDEEPGPDLVEAHALGHRQRAEQARAVEADEGAVEQQVRVAVEQVRPDDAVQVTDGEQHAEPGGNRPPRRRVGRAHRHETESDGDHEAARLRPVRTMVSENSRGERLAMARG
jgi:hypothetical protein